MNAYNYRRKDNFIPRSMREAFGNDDTFEPEIRCVSESWGIKRKRPAFPLFMVIVAIAVVVWQVVAIYGH